MKKIMHTKKEEGITLVTLVVTIVVMLILAGVSIYLLLGENGVGKRAQQAKEEYERKSVMDGIKLAIADYTMGSVLEDKRSFHECVKDVTSVEEAEEVKIGSYVYYDRCYAKIIDEWYTVYTDGEIEEGRIVWDGTISEELKQDENGAYLIESGSDLAYLAQEVNNGNKFTGETFLLTKNIDLGARKDIDGEWYKGLREWTTIGISGISKSFGGIFDGQDNTIRGLYIEDSTKITGIFGNNSGTIKNIELKYNYSCGYVSSALVGYNSSNGVIENCRSVEAGITGIIEEKGVCYGCIVGNNYGKIINCYNSGEIIVQGTFNNNDDERILISLGGIVFQNYGTVENCYNSGNLTNASVLTGIGDTNVSDDKQVDFSVAGVSYSNHGIMKNCYNTGSIELNQSGLKAGQAYCAGVTVFNVLTLENCYNLGSITDLGIATHAYAGGITAYNQKGTLKSSYNSGKITNTCVGGLKTGGISGQNTGVINSCYNTGSITATNGSTGGIGGGQYNPSGAIAKIINCYNIGSVSVKSGSRGGILGTSSRNCAK